MESVRGYTGDISSLSSNWENGFTTVAANSSHWASGDVALTHPNASATLRLFKEQVQSGLSTDLVVIGDSTGDGTDRWPRVLAEKLATAYPGHNVKIQNKTSSTNKTWVSTTVQAVSGSVEPREYWRPLFPDTWAAGIYSAGDYVGTVCAVFTGSTSSTTLTVDAMSSGTIVIGAYIAWSGLTLPIQILSQITGTVGGVGTYRINQASNTGPVTMTQQNTWWSLIGNNSEAPSKLALNWVLSNLQNQVIISSEDVPWLHSDTPTSSTSPFEVEIDLIYHLDNTSRLLWWKTGTVKLYMQGAGAQCHWYDGAGTPHYAGFFNPATASAVFGSYANGDRIQISFSFVPTTGVKRIKSRKWNGSSWGSWTSDYVTTGEPGATTIQKNKGIIYSVGGHTSSLYGITLRRSAGGIVDCDLSVDQYTGFGTKNRNFLGAPTITIWNYSWSGQELNAFIGDSYLFGTTYVDYDNDFTPRNTCAVLVNLGHNDHAVSSGKEDAVKMARLKDLVSARFPRAAFVVMSQNPGVDARSYGPPGQYLDYTPVNYIKRMRQSHIQQAALANNWGFIDINKVFRDSGIESSLSTDGLHPNANGSDLWADTIFNIIES